MTLDEAKYVADLLKLRGDLSYELDELKQCCLVNAEVRSENCCRPRYWEQGKDREIEYLKAGYEADIEKIDNILCSLPSLNLEGRQET